MELPLPERSVCRFADDYWSPRKSSLLAPPWNASDGRYCSPHTLLTSVNHSRPASSKTLEQAVTRSELFRLPFHVRSTIYGYVLGAARIVNVSPRNFYATSFILSYCPDAQQAVNESCKGTSHAHRARLAGCTLIRTAIFFVCHLIRNELLHHLHTYHVIRCKSFGHLIWYCAAFPDHVFSIRNLAVEEIILSEGTQPV